MNPREKSIAIGVGVTAALILLYFGWSSYTAKVRAREDLIAKVKSEITKVSGQLRKSQKGAARLREYQARSLPSDPDVARSLYQKWLFERAQLAGLSGQSTAAVSARQYERIGTQFTFSAKGEATLPQVVKLLDGIYRDDLLQRITKLSIKPVPNTKLLDVSLTIEAISLAKADATDTLPKVPTTSLTLPDADAYSAIICGRNLFGPKNNVPSVSSVSSQTATINREFTYTLQAKDPDPLDKVKYKLLEPVAGVSLDEITGKLRFTPKELGKQQLVVQISDDGLPAASTKATLTVNVEAPKPPPPPEVKPPEGPKKLAFDQAKYTALTAVVEVNDEREVWLLVRPTGETLKLKAGAKFEIGSIKGVIDAIGEDDFTFQTTGSDQPRRVGKGETLEKAQTVER